MRSRITDFLIVSISHQNEFDHSFDHLQLRTTWKQCPQEHPKAPFSDTKAPKSLINQGKNLCRFVWEHDVAGSNPVIPTILALEQDFQSLFSLFSATQILRVDSFSSVSPRSLSSSRQIGIYRYNSILISYLSPMSI